MYTLIQHYMPDLCDSGHGLDISEAISRPGALLLRRLSHGAEVQLQQGGSQVRLPAHLQHDAYHAQSAQG